MGRIDAHQQHHSATAGAPAVRPLGRARPRRTSRTPVPSSASCPLQTTESRCFHESRRNVRASRAEARTDAVRTPAPTQQSRALPSWSMHSSFLTSRRTLDTIRHGPCVQRSACSGINIEFVISRLFQQCFGRVLEVLGGAGLGLPRSAYWR